MRMVPNNLPVQLSSFIGREQEIAELKRLLTTTRLLTLTGSGGCGKTRLALQVAAALQDTFPDGVWFVDFAPLSDPALVPQRIAATLSVREQPGLPLLSTLCAALAEKQLLLILDNCEHLIEACALATDALLRACPGIQVMATSREALRIDGETVYRVPSMHLPESKEQQSPDVLMHSDAARLFVERARSARADFVLDSVNVPAVAQICSRLDGMPLAIELAAARLRVLSVEQIAVRLDDRFRLLTSGSRTARPRHQTLHALIAWSYDLLSEPERLLLQRLSVFAGGWGTSAAEAIGAGDGIGAADVLDLLARLVQPG